MAGSISLSLSQQFDAQGRPLAGGKLYFFQSGTTTPQNAYQDSALTIPHANPIILDASGRVPAFYLADGFIKIRLADVNGVTIISADALLVIGPSSGAGAGPAVDPTTVLATGDVKYRYGIGVVSGFVRGNGRTIGSATSGGTERANSDAQALFEYLWGADATLAVSGGRGGTANADWLANKTIALPDFRGRVLAAMDDMGAAAAGRLTAAGSGVTGTTLGASGGGETVTLVTGNLPAYTPAGTNAVPTITLKTRGITLPGAGAFRMPVDDGGDTGTDGGSNIASAPASTFTGTAQGGVSTPVNKVQPTLALTVYIKL